MADTPTLIPQYKKFAEEYLRCFNGKAAAIAAGYSPKNAAHQGMTLLRRPEIKAYIDARLEETAASANEVLAFLTQVMRGEVKDQFGLDAALADRIKAAGEISKRFKNTEEAAQIQKAIELLGGINGVIK